MTATIKVTETKEVEKVVNVDLPYYSTDGHSTFYRINPNGSITTCFAGKSYADMNTSLNDNGGSYQRTLKYALEGTKTTYEKFMEALEKSRAFQEEQMLSTVNA